MTIIDKEDVAAAIGSRMAVSGLAGHHVHRDLANINLSGLVPTAEFVTNTESVTRAMRTSGADQIAPRPITGSAQAKANSANDKVNSQYAGMFRGNRKADADRFVGQAYRPDYRNLLSPILPAARIMPKGPLQWHNRQLEKTRRGLDQALETKKQNVQINPDSLSQNAKRKIAEHGKRTGATHTMLGTMSQTLQKAGYDPKQWKRWEHALEGGFFAAPKPTGSL